MKVAFGETPDEFSQLILWPIYLELIGLILYSKLKMK